MGNLGDVIKSQGKEIDITVNVLALMKHLIKERAHPLDLLRELISNSGAKEVGATEIRIKYTVDEEGHIFEVIDNGCGMDYTEDEAFPGRLDKFFGLGLSEIVGIKSDEFSWKGLGSKLSYQSKKIEIETWCGTGDAIRVEINEPWSSIERKLKPRPKVFRYKPETGKATGTSIRVIGHPPHRQEQAFSFDEIKNFLLHRTFVGFTRERTNKPKIFLSVLGQTQEINFGLPELKFQEQKEGIVFVNKQHKFTKSGTNKSVNVLMKGFYTWDAINYGLDKKQLNTGMILSVKGIPYFTLSMKEYGSGSLATARPGEDKCCLIAECDDIQEEMNIARSGLNDSETTAIFKKVIQEIFNEIESSQEYLKFRKVQEDRKTIESAGELGVKKKTLESDNQSWVVYQRNETEKPILLCREPECENDVLCLSWKLEALKALPFKNFQTLAYVGSGKKGGPDIIAHFQEDQQSDPERYVPIEVENKFYNYDLHGHKLSQFPKVLCWEIGKTPKISIDRTDKKYKHTSIKEDLQIHIFSIRLMDGIKIVKKKEFDKYGLIS